MPAFGLPTHPAMDQFQYHVVHKTPPLVGDLNLLATSNLARLVRRLQAVCAPSHASLLGATSFSFFGFFGFCAASPCFFAESYFFVGLVRGATETEAAPETLVISS